jgi:hypothetical protein
VVVNKTNKIYYLCKVIVKLIYFTYKKIEKLHQLILISKMNKCDKCNQGFKTKHLLTNHIKRKIPCDQIISCTVCDKICKTPQELERHKTRIKPCKPTNKVSEIGVNNQLEIAKIQLKREKIDATLRLKELDLEMTKLKLISYEKLEIIKNDRKAMTVSISKHIEETNEKRILKKIEDENNRIIQELSVKLIVPNMVELNSENITKVIKYRYQNPSTFNHTDGISLIRKCYNLNYLNFEDLNNEMFKPIYNSSDFPDNKLMFYVRDNDQFYKTSRNAKNKIVLTIANFDTEIFPVIKPNVLLHWVEIIDMFKLLADEIPFDKELKDFLETNMTGDRKDSCTEEFIVRFKNCLKSILDIEAPMKFEEDEAKSIREYIKFCKIAKPN